ncbi:adenylate kinase family enzyme [Catenibacillus scindens]|uniref:Adenylate kinase family enzyme n=1 Tax=Catenibacillus scindens TaxID=673271 RepID=A0A7W8M6A4_9FIRM|nr:AAA family ATPase [Catenibacillus scindens]MBB5265372.1 adenylate kinase family enzyme [Catenibacillus scindens]
MAIILSLCGYPGFGKTTQSKKIKSYYGNQAVILSVPKLLAYDVESISVLTEDEVNLIHKNANNANKSMERGVLVDAFIDELLYRAVARFMYKKDVIILDGSPRDLNSFKLFMNLSDTESSNRIIFIYLKTEGNEIDLSINRQIKRAKKEGTQAFTNLEQFEQKTHVFDNFTKSNFRELLYQNHKKVEYYEIICVQEENIVFDNIIKHIVIPVK